MADKLLEIKDLEVLYKSGKNPVHAVNGISLTLNKGETLGLVGETGAGKTTTVASDLAALDLRRGGTDTKQKSFRELQPHGSSSFYLLWVYILVYIVCVFPVSRKCQFWTKAGLKICSGFHIAKLR